MERTIGVDKARAKLGQIAEKIAADDEAVVLTRRGQAGGSAHQPVRVRLAI
jgi:PHD/YefM family antitoxin component YafN of YafNO toxin-antitoxin module